MSYRIDWTQFLAAVVALASYAATIAAMFAFYIPWPVTVPLMTVTFIAAGIWSHHRDVNEIGAASNE
ncbi:hypothetical protein HMPREF1522_1208 [Actinomyces sp. ICM54]|uniref:hypothetical protein n=1 Tax=Actinomyces sp. ICM54 TaxID=936549 RepID=UPI00044DB965|nr:hypothetical protein [Actinomyces sp. ICM54]EWC99160.1 hypothetical protein HMPREF1522_1208 [Actinomyces sp. ICM54]